MENNELKNILKNMTIAYVEDEDIIRENMTKTLNLLCGECVSFNNAKELLIHLKTNNIDIVLTDINLPKMDGIELIKQLRNQNENIPIILLTAYLETEYLLKAIEYRVVEYLNKPVDYETLLNALLKAVKEIVRTGQYIIKINSTLFYNVLKKELKNNKNNKIINLTTKELKLFELLLKNKNRVVSYDEIKTDVWNSAYEVTESAFKNLLSKLRNKVGKDIIVNISKVGYRLEVEVN
ncbi:two-component system response regulator [Malaciobacter halophilus]|nr:response regulator [Malaciobacter halophilus]AXH10808.1 two-component system response regulator [Malaciobacter halophilus]